MAGSAEPAGAANISDCASRDSLLPVTENEMKRKKVATEVIASSDIKEAVTNYFYKYRSSTKWWSFCLYSSLFGAAVLSAWAGILPQLSSSTKDIATVLAVTASLVNTIAGIGRFDQKWQASRTARAATERLKIALLENQDPSLIGRQLEQIIVNQSAGIVGSHATAEK